MRTYSPTVVTLYKTTNYNHVKRVNSYGDMDAYDIEGYDEYGYDRHGVDRAGCKEYEYRGNDTMYARVKKEWADYKGIQSTSAFVKKIEEVNVILYTPYGQVKTAYPIEMFDDAVSLFKDYVSHGKKASISTS